MAKRQRIWARQARLRLISEYGGRCQRCGSTTALHFHVVSQEHSHHRLGIAGRTIFYRREAARGNLRLLCADCHQLTHSYTPF